MRVYIVDKDLFIIFSLFEWANIIEKSLLVSIVIVFASFFLPKFFFCFCLNNGFIYWDGQKSHCVWKKWFDYTVSTNPIKMTGKKYDSYGWYLPTGKNRLFSFFRFWRYFCHDIHTRYTWINSMSLPSS